MEGAAGTSWGLGQHRQEPPPAVAAVVAAVATATVDLGEMDVGAVANMRLELGQFGRQI